MNQHSRRRFLQALAIAAPSLALSGRLAAQVEIPDTINPGIGSYPDSWLPEGVRSRFVEGVNDLRMHVLEAGFETPDRPALVMLHGFPELAYSWRKVMKPLADAGYHVIVPDLRGYGRTTGWSSDYDTDLAPFRMLNKVRDVIGLIYAYGYEHVACVIGHDFGSPLAGWCAMTRPDIFRAVVMMSAPFGGVPTIPFDTIDNPPPAPPEGPGIHENLANLPRPRKHYQRYYTTREANENMWHAEQGLSDFIRAYYHHKSADWEQNRPYRLAARTAEEWAKMPTYYIMDLAEGMAETVAHHMPTPELAAANDWLTEAELAVYATEFGRTGFQGGLNSYRMGATGIGAAETQLYAGKTIDQPGSLRHRNSRKRKFAIAAPPAGRLRRILVDMQRNRAAGGVDESGFAAVNSCGAGSWHVHQRRERLGHLSESRQFRTYAGNSLHRHARRTPGRGRRALGATGAGGRNQPPAAGVSERTLSRDTRIG